MNERNSIAIRRLRPGWILILAGAIFFAFAGLSWWTARTTIRETRRLGGWTGVASSLIAFEPFAIDAMIQQIGFTETAIPDEVVDRVIRDLPGLSTVSLARCQISDANLRRLREIPSLNDLDLRDTETNDASAAVLAELTRVRHLALDGTRITDAALPELAKLPNLYYLGLGRTQVGDTGLAALRSHSSLRSLDLSHTNVTDEGLEHLRGLNLTILRLDGTRVTAEGLARFRQTFRGTIIGGSPP